MGYTHYWERERTIDPATFHWITADFSRLILPLHDKGVSLAGPLGRHVAEITDDRIAFNGVADYGHPSQEICIPHPDDDAWGVGHASDAVSGHAFLHTLLRHRACDGNCSYETFTFDRVQQPRFAEDSDASCSEYCKTGFRPYDLAVQCFLVIAKHHMRYRIKVTSGGTEQHWKEAKTFCYTHLGYPLAEFHMDPEDGLIESDDLR